MTLALGRPRAARNGFLLFAGRWTGLGLAVWSLLGAIACHAVQDEIDGDDFEGFDHPFCDSGLTTYSTTGADYAAAIDLCRTTTEQSTAWGVISASLTLADGTGTAATLSHSIRPSLGSGMTPQAGSALAVFSTGAAAGSSDPGFSPFQPGDDTGTSSSAPADWLAANGGAFPVAPGCPAAPSTTAQNPVMLTLRIRVPNNARSFSLNANFLSSEFPEWVCSAYNDVFVALLDSAFAGYPANPPDKNLARYTSSAKTYPLGVNLAIDNTGLFTQCVNGTIACAGLSSSTITTCTGTSQLAGTGMDTADPSVCGDPGSQVGGATGWLALRGNVLPGEIIQLRLAIWDTGDALLDSEVVLDNFRWSYDTVTPGTTLN